MPEPIEAPTRSEIPSHHGVCAVLDPKGTQQEIVLTPLAERLVDLDGQTVYLIDAMPHGSGMTTFLSTLRDALVQRFSDISIVLMNRGTGYMRDDPGQRQDIADGADAYIYGGSPTGSLTAAGFEYAMKLEAAGLPGAALTFDTLTNVADHIREEIGSPIRYVAISFPFSKMTPEKQADAVDSVVDALVRPLDDDERRTGVCRPPEDTPIFVRGTWDEIQDAFYRSGLGDGLPVVPPTAERVRAMLKGTRHAPEEKVACAMPPMRRKVTVEKVAVNAVMAGGRPEYMPVLLALAEALGRNADSVNTWVRSTNSFAFMQVINGPVRHELEMNAGACALGPGNRANAVIGRSMGLMIRNLGGGRIDLNMLGVQGNASGYAFAFAENEEQSPWSSLSLEKGYNRETSTLSLFAGGWAHTGNFFQVEDGLEFLARGLASFELPNGAVALISPQRARLLADAGLDKQAVKETIWKAAVAPLKDFRSTAYFGGLITSSIKQRGTWPATYLTDPDDRVVPVYPEGSIEVIVVGGDAAPTMQGWKMTYVDTVSVDKWR